MKKTCLFFIALLFTLPAAMANRTSVESIVNFPGRYEHEHVVFEGHIMRYVAGTPTTSSYYEIQGDYGARLRVNTTAPKPIILKRYQVKGTLIIYNDAPLVIESEKRLLEEAPARIVPPVADPKEIVPETTWLQDNMLYVLIVAGGVVLVLIVLIIVFANRRTPVEPVKPGTGRAEENRETIVEKPSFSTPSQYKTVRMAVNTPKTMRFMPGRLEIISTEDKGKSFKLTGFPAENGSVVTLGRESVLGEKGYSHIQLNDQTVSRKQAEIIYRDDKMFIKNLSETNYSKVDGREVKPNEVAEITNGTIIKTGAIEFKYVRE